MQFNFEKKFSEKQIDRFINTIYNNVTKKPEDSYYFDLRKTEWMSNQGLLLFTSVLRYLLEKNINFEVVFIQKGTPTSQVPRRVAIHIIQMWEIWGLWKIFDVDNCEKHLGITYSTIESLKKIHLKEDFHRAKIYDMFEITPFVELEKISNYDDKNIIEQLDNYHKLNDATEDIVTTYNCEHPFINSVFGNIISKEIYENFLDHFNKSFFSVKNEYAFMSVAVKGMLDEEKAKQKGYSIQNYLQINFKEEELDEAIDFFYDDIQKEYKNQSYITYSFLDFGDGICSTLRKEYQKSHSDGNDYDILKFAFKHNTSRHPIKNPFNSEKIEDFIPRGLFDVLSLVQRYNGLLIARSCYGKVLYDFSNTKSINEACKIFGDTTSFFPGTFFTIYLPALKKGQELDNSVFIPEYNIPEYNRLNKKIVSVYEILKHAGLKDKDERYNVLLSNFNKLLPKNNRLLNLISFKNIDDLQLLKKIVFYLLTNQNVNHNNCFLLFHPPSRKFLQEINYELSNLTPLDKNFKVHPLPLIYKNEGETEVFWLGLYNEKDIKKLDELLYDVFSIRKNDFTEPDSIKGHFNDYDEHGNLTSDFPTIDEIHDYIGYLEVKDLVSSDIYISRAEGYVYLCSGNYYQTEFYEMTKMLNDSNLCMLVSKLLYENVETKLSETIKVPRKRKYIAITSSSHLIVDSLLNQNIIHSPTDIIYFDNYHIDNLESKLPEDASEYHYILLCDVLSTGAMAHNLKNNLNELGGTLACISVIINAVEEENKDYESIKNLVIQIHNYPIKKYYKKDISSSGNSEIEKSIKESKIIRINPYTNVPITFSIEETNPDNIILTNNEFLDIINENHIRTGGLIFNTLLHPYFFITSEIIKESGIELFQKIFTTKKRIRGENRCILDSIETKNLNIFYPKKSDIEYLDFKLFKQIVLKADRGVNNYKLERYPTEEGWKFPHTTEYFKKIVNDNPVLILDDGSCTGASLKQMINEIAFFNPKKITLVCLIGRISEHKREFLTSISQIVKGINIIDIEIFFGSFWHVPTFYLDDNPNTKERIWLSRILNLSNLPTEINKVANEINGILEPKDVLHYEDYKYFPRENKKIPKKDIIHVRDEIGKIIGYRFYKESFDYFNEFIRLYSFKEKSIDRYKTIELICAVIAYEPYIYGRIKTIMPDVTEKLIDFIDVLILKSPRKLSSPPLSYQWNIRDIFHIFFILNEDEQIYNKLLTSSNFNNLVRFIELNDKTSINYLLFRILRYFPLEISEMPRNIDRKFLVLLNKFKKNKEFSGEARRMIKVFISFIFTLPKRKSFENQLLVLNKNFESIEDDQFHLSNIVANLGLMLSDITIRLKNYDSASLIKFRASWKIVSRFIEPLLSFYISFPSFFPDKISNQIEDIKVIFKKLNQRIIIRINDSNILNIKNDLKTLQSEYFNCDSELFELFIKPTTTELYKKISNKIVEFSKTHIGVNRPIELKGEIDDNLVVDFPDYYFSNVVLDTLFNNFRHGAENEKIMMLIKADTELGYFSLETWNLISEEIDSGGGNGLTKLVQARSYPKDKFDYQFETIGSSTFYQVIRIKFI